MQYININHLAPDEEEFSTPHSSDWAHVAVHMAKGSILSKTNPYYGECFHYLKAVHFTHSTEMNEALCTRINKLLESYEANGLEQRGRLTTLTLRQAHLTPPWNTFSLGTFDGLASGCRDLPLILPSNQCQESWHKQLMKLLQGKLRGSTDYVLKTSMPRILLDDTLNMPRELCFEPTHINPKMLRKALRIIAAESTMTRCHGAVFFVIRIKGKLEKLSARNVTDYKEVLNGRDPKYYRAFNDAEPDSKEALLAWIEVAQSMHSVFVQGKGPTGMYISSMLNPAELVCTCKGFKVSSNCSHTIAITALFVTDAMCVPGKKSYDNAYLETLLEKVSAVTRAAHRPRKTVGGSHIQPTDDTRGDEEEDDDEESESEESDHDEDLTEV